MRVEWLFNGKSIPQGHRFRTTYDFGFVALDILYAYPEDSGTYTCRAINALGETSSTSNLTVQGNSYYPYQTFTDFICSIVSHLVFLAIAIVDGAKF